MLDIFVFNFYNLIYKLSFLYPKLFFFFIILGKTGIMKIFLGNKFVYSHYFKIFFNNYISKINRFFYRNCKMLLFFFLKCKC